MKSQKNPISFFLLLGIQLSLYASCSPNEKSSPTDNQEKKNKENTDVTVYITTANRAFDLVKKTTTLKSGSSMSPTTITLQPEIKYQNMDGFRSGSNRLHLLQFVTNASPKTFSILKRDLFSHRWLWLKLHSHLYRLFRFLTKRIYLL